MYLETALLVCGFLSPWQLTSLCLSFLTSKMEIIIVSLKRAQKSVQEVTKSSINVNYHC